MRLLTPDGKPGPTFHIENQFQNGLLVWTPDGKSLAIRVNGNNTIQLFAPDGKPGETLARQGGAISRISRSTPPASGWPGSTANG